MSTVIGNVEILNGSYTLKSENGETSELQAGDEIHLNDTIIGSDSNPLDSNIMVSMLSEDAEDIFLSSNEVMLFDSSLLSEGFSNDDVESETNSITDLLASYGDIDDIETEAGEEVVESTEQLGGFGERDANIGNVDVEVGESSHTFNLESQFENEEDDAIASDSLSSNAPTNTPLTVESPQTEVTPTTPTSTTPTPEVQVTPTTTTPTPEVAETSTTPSVEPTPEVAETSTTPSVEPTPEVAETSTPPSVEPTPEVAETSTPPAVEAAPEVVETPTAPIVETNIITGTDGKDSIKGTDSADTIDAGAGNDNIKSGAGDDVITSGTGRNSINAGDGDDTINLTEGDGKASYEVVRGGDGSDTVVFNGERADYSVTHDDNKGRFVIEDVESGERNYIYDDVETVQFSDGAFSTSDANFDNDTVTTGDGADRINTGSGDDSIDSGAGNDRINSGDGDDVINAGDGKDSINSGDGNDTIDAGAGNDNIKSGAGDDVITGGTGRNSINAGDGDDTINLTEGDGKASYEVVRGGDGSDTVVFNGERADYSVTHDDNKGRFVIEDVESGERNYIYDDVETVQFSDGSFSTSDANFDNDPITQVVDTDSTDNSVSENVEVGTYTGVTLNATDADGDAISYSVAEDIPFSVGADGKVVTDGEIDFETASEYTFDVTATSADGTSSTQSVTIEVLNIVENIAPKVADDTLMDVDPMIRLNEMPEHGVMQVQNDEGEWEDMVEGQEYAADSQIQFVPDVEAVQEATRDIEIGSFDANSESSKFDGKVSTSDWGEVDGNSAVFTDNGTTITTTSSSGNLTAYNGSGGHVGAGIGDNDNSGLSQGEVLTVQIEGEDINQITFTLDGLGSYFDESSSHATEVTIKAFDAQNNLIDSDGGYRDSGSYTDTYSFTTTTPVDHFELSTSGSDGNYVVQNMTVSRTLSDEVEITTIQADGSETSTTLALDLNHNTAETPVDMSEKLIDVNSSITQGTITTDEDSSISIDVLANDSDADEDALSITHIEGQDVRDGNVATIENDNDTLGSATVVDGKIEFTPSAHLQEMNDSESQDVSFSYTVSDSNGGTADANVTVHVTGSNEVVQAQAFDNVEEVTPLNATLSGDIIDGLTFTTSSGLNGVVDEDGGFTFNEGDTVTFSHEGEVVSTLDSSLIGEDGVIKLDDTLESKEKEVKEHDDKGHGNDVDGVDEDNPALAKKEGEPDSKKEKESDEEADDKGPKDKKEHDDKGHGNDEDGVDEDNPAHAKKESDGDEEPNVLGNIEELVKEAKEEAAPQADEKEDISLGDVLEITPKDEEIPLPENDPSDPTAPSGDNGAAPAAPEAPDSSFDPTVQIEIVDDPTMGEM